MHYYFDPEKANYLNLQRSATAAYSLQYHCVFGTKYSHPIFDRQKASDLTQLILEISQENGYHLLGLQIQTNHIHILISLKPSHNLSQAIQRIKGKSSRFLRHKYPDLKKLPALWTPSNFYRSLGQVSVAQIKAYLDRQDEHHQWQRNITTLAKARV
ncbi:MAG TPA: IS200/IS605 family transposase [Candidatus Subteraquimicrobiales bacterium]